MTTRPTCSRCTHYHVCRRSFGTQPNWTCAYTPSRWVEAVKLKETAK